MAHYSDTLFSPEEEKDERYYANALLLDASIELEKALKDCGLTQRALADRMGSSESYVSQVLGGGKNITLKTLSRFAYNLGFVFRLQRSLLSDGMTHRAEKWDASAPSLESSCIPCNDNFALAA